MLARKAKPGENLILTAKVEHGSAVVWGIRPWAIYCAKQLYFCSVAQSRPTLCNLMDCSPPGSSVHRSSPGKNTGVGCHVMAQALPSLQSFNFIFLFWKVSENMCLEAFGIKWGQKTKFLPLISGEVKLNPRPWLPGSTFFHTGSDLRTKNNNRNGDYRCDHHQL